MTTRTQPHWIGDRSQQMSRDVELGGILYQLRTWRTARGTWRWTVTSYDAADGNRVIDWTIAETWSLGDAMAAAEFKTTLGYTTHKPARPKKDRKEDTMQKVKLYHVTCTEAWNAWTTGEGWSLEPWPGDGTYTRGYDDGGHDYVLPDGYHLGEIKDGSPAIFKDGNDRAVTLIDSDGRPALAVSMQGLVLEPAED